jgi:hypothetical protein
MVLLGSVWTAPRAIAMLSACAGRHAADVGDAVWLQLVLCAQDLVCWAQALLLDGELAVAEPKALCYRLLHVAARIVRHARRVILRLQTSWPWTVELARAFARLRALPQRC